MAPDAAMAELFFSVLPRHAVLRADAGARRIGALMHAVHAENLTAEAPGSAFAAGRLIDLVMLEVLRTLATHSETGPAGVLRAMVLPAGILSEDRGPALGPGRAPRASLLRGLPAPRAPERPRELRIGAV